MAGWNKFRTETLRYFVPGYNVIADNIPAGYEYALPTGGTNDEVAGSTAVLLYSWGKQIRAMPTGIGMVSSIEIIIALQLVHTHPTWNISFNQLIFIGLMNRLQTRG